MRSRARFLAFAVTGALILGAIPSPVLAACNPGGANLDGTWFAGPDIKVPANIPRQVRSDIEEYSPFVEIGPVTSAWVMLYRGGTKWAQMGWWKETNARFMFVQWTDDSGHWFTELLDDFPVGTFSTYEVNYNPGPSEFVFQVDNSNYWYVSPTLWQPNALAAKGESHNYTDQMPGGTQAPMWLDRVQYTTGGQWINIGTAAVATDPNKHGALKSSNQLYKIWDKACNS